MREWHKKCVASTVVDCLVAPPPPPPPLLTPPTPCGIRCRLANKLANSTHDKAARQAAGKLTATVGAGLGKVKGKVFRIGHLGSFNDLMLMGTLCGVEMGLAATGIGTRTSGVAAAMDMLTEPAQRMAAQ